MIINGENEISHSPRFFLKGQFVAIFLELLILLLLLIVLFGVVFFFSVPFYFIRDIFKFKRDKRWLLSMFIPFGFILYLKKVKPNIKD